ncbi:hypothetical protein MTO96_030033 [Rhipicephalus appendiculatus]
MPWYTLSLQVTWTVADPKHPATPRRATGLDRVPADLVVLTRAELRFNRGPSTRPAVILATAERCLGEVCAPPIAESR